jgi:alcohol dehydrogenase class IV
MGVVKLVAENLREFAYNRMNYQACEAMCWASSMGGLALAFGGGPGGRFSVHGFGHHVGAVTDGHHGFVNGALTIPIEKHNENLFPEKFAEMARTMGVDTRGMTKMQAADKWFDEMERLLTDLNIKSGHLNEQFGLKLADLDHIIDTVLNDFMIHVEKKEEKAYRVEAHKLLESML